jgi:hypothetical protein
MLPAPAAHGVGMLVDRVLIARASTSAVSAAPPAERISSATTSSFARVRPARTRGRPHGRTRGRRRRRSIRPLRRSPRSGSRAAHLPPQVHTFQNRERLTSRNSALADQSPWKQPDCTASASPRDERASAPAPARRPPWTTDETQGSRGNFFWGGVGRGRFAQGRRSAPVSSFRSGGASGRRVWPLFAQAGIAPTAVDGGGRR